MTVLHGGGAAKIEQQRDVTDLHTSVNLGQLPGTLFTRRLGPYGEGMRRGLLGLVVVTLLLASCGDDDTETTTDTTETTAVTDDDATSSTTEADDTSTTAASAPSELPGERIDIFPYEGTTVAVVGVEAGDVLNVRAAPGTQYEVVAELDPLADDLTANGHNRTLDDDSIWAEITADGTTGWANTKFLAHLGDVGDVTTELYPDVADRPTAETMVQLAQIVGDNRAGSELPEPEMVIVDGPSVGDLGEVTIDLVGYPDDAVLGERLHIFAEPDPGGESFTVRTVESTTLCRRGVSAGACV